MRRCVTGRQGEHLGQRRFGHREAREPVLGTEDDTIEMFDHRHSDQRLDIFGIEPPLLVFFMTNQPV
jgi:hypothetical protein